MTLVSLVLQFCLNSQIEFVIAEILALPEDTQENENCGNDDVTSVSSPSAMVYVLTGLWKYC